MKFLVDMNLSPLWVPFFASHELASVHWSTIGKPSAPDNEIMDFAVANEYIVFTHDLDFGILLAAHRLNGPSVIQLRSQEVLPSAIGEAVLRAIRAAKPHIEKGAIVTVDPVRQRIRLLPIG
jgi:predicted nuclease of predicted toxin-antitoxin system